MNPPSHLLPHQQPVDMSLLSFSLGKALKNGKRTDQACMFRCHTVRSRLISSAGLLNLQVIHPSLTDEVTLSSSRRDKVGCDGNRFDPSSITLRDTLSYGPVDLVAYARRRDIHQISA